MKRRIFVVNLVMILAVVLLVTGCAAPSASPPEQEPSEQEGMTWWQKEGLPQILIDAQLTRAESICTKYSSVKWADDIEKITLGRVTINRVYEQSLYATADALMALEAGIVGFGGVWNPSFPGRLPLYDIFHHPGLMPNQGTSDPVIRDIVDKYPCYLEQFDEDKVVYLANTVHMRSDIHSVKPIRTIDDLKGKVIVCTSEDAAKSLALLGASATVMTGTDAYMAVQTGVADGIFSAWGWAEIYNFHEVAPYHYIVMLCPGTMTWLYSRDFFDQLTPLEQNALLAYGMECVFGMTKGNAWSSQAYRDAIPDENFCYISPEDEAKMKQTFAPSWEKWANDMEELGYPGNDILADIEYYIKAYTFG